MTNKKSWFKITNGEIKKDVGKKNVIFFIKKEKLKVGKINVTIMIDQGTNKCVKVTIDKNAKLRDLLSEASKSENMKGINYLKFVLPDGYLVGPESLDKKLNELGFKDKSCECWISPYTLDNNKKGKDKWKDWIDLKSISSSQNENNEDGKKNDSDTITLSIWDFGDGKEITNLKVAKNTTMGEIKEQLKQKYSLSDARIDELHLYRHSADIFYNLDETVKQVLCKGDIEKREVKAYTKGFDFNLKKSKNEKNCDIFLDVYDSNNKDTTYLGEAYNKGFDFNLKISENKEKCEIFLCVYDSNNYMQKYSGQAYTKTTVIGLIKDNLVTFKDFSAGFIIVVGSKVITGEFKLENQIVELEEGSRIKVYLAGCSTCDGKNLIKIENLNLDLEKNNGENTDPANKNNWPFSRIIVGIIDLFFLAAAITTFLLYFLAALSLPIAVLIVLTALFVIGFVIGTVLFFRWHKILPKISPELWVKKINGREVEGKNIDGQTKENCPKSQLLKERNI